MTSLTVPTSAESLERFRQEVGGVPKEWYIGISLDAAARLRHHGLEVGSLAQWIACEDEKTAREIERLFLAAGFRYAVVASQKGRHKNGGRAFARPRIYPSELIEMDRERVLL